MSVDIEILNDGMLEVVTLVNPGVDVEVEAPETAVIEVAVGIRGPAGEGGSSFRYVHVQDTPSDEWTISHNLNGFPNVTVVDSAGTVVNGARQYLDANTVVLRFVGAFSGKAYLS